MIFEQSTAVLPFTTGVKILDTDPSDSRGEDVWVLTTNLNNYIKNTMDLNKINFHVLKGNVADIVSGTLCEPKQHDAVETLDGVYFFEIEE